MYKTELIGGCLCVYILNNNYLLNKSLVLDAITIHEREAERWAGPIRYERLIRREASKVDDLTKPEMDFFDVSKYDYKLIGQLKLINGSW